MGLDKQIQGIKTKIMPILEKHGVSKAAVFGSTVRGEATADSDVDVLVELPLDKGLLDFIALKYELEDALGKSVDLVEYSTIHPLLKSEILKEQVPILQ